MSWGKDRGTLEGVAAHAGMQAGCRAGRAVRIPHLQHPQRPKAEHRASRGTGCVTARAALLGAAHFPLELLRGLWDAQ